MSNMYNHPYYLPNSMPNQFSGAMASHLQSPMRMPNYNYGVPYSSAINNFPNYNLNNQIAPAARTMGNAAGAASRAGGKGGFLGRLFGGGGAAAAQSLPISTPAAVGGAKQGLGALAKLPGKFSLGGVLSGAQKSINTYNQIIPIYNQVKPLVNKGRTLFSVAKAMKKIEKEDSGDKTQTNNQPEIEIVDKEEVLNAKVIDQSEYEHKYVNKKKSKNDIPGPFFNK